VRIRSRRPARMLRPLWRRSRRPSAALPRCIDLGGIGAWARTGSASMLDSLYASPYLPASRWHSSMWSA